MPELEEIWAELSSERQLRLSPARARLHARLSLAVMRGLLLDLLTTGDREGTTAALRHFARNMPPESLQSCARRVRSTRR